MCLTDNNNNGQESEKTKLQNRCVPGKLAALIVTNNKLRHLLV